MGKLSFVEVVTKWLTPERGQPEEDPKSFCFTQLGDDLFWCVLSDAH